MKPSGLTSASTLSPPAVRRAWEQQDYAALLSMPGDSGFVRLIQTAAQAAGVSVTQATLTGGKVRVGLSTQLLDAAIQALPSDADQKTLQGLRNVGHISGRQVQLDLSPADHETFIRLLALASPLLQHADSRVLGNWHHRLALLTTHAAQGTGPRGVHEGSPSPGYVNHLERLQVRGAQGNEVPFHFAATAGRIRYPQATVDVRGEENPEWFPGIQEAAALIKETIPDLTPLVGKDGYQACGQFTCVYFSSKFPTVVWKFSGDVTDAAAWQHVLNYNRPVEAVARTQSVIHLPLANNPDPRPIFLIVQPKLEALSDKEEGFFEGLRRVTLEHVLGQDTDWDRAVSEYAVTYKLTHREETAFLENVRRLRRGLLTLQGLGIQLRDLHGGNVRKDKAGFWQIMDLGVSYSPEVSVTTARIPKGVDSSQGPKGRRGTTEPSPSSNKKLAKIREYSTVELGKARIRAGTPPGEAPKVQPFPDLLYTGTDISRIDSILSLGVVPRAVHGKASIHNTKTASSTFFTDSLHGALAYATGAHPPEEALLLVIDVKDLPLRGDTDDTQSVDSVVLMELQTAFPEIRWRGAGTRIPDSKARSVENFLSDLSSEGVTSTFSVHHHKDGHSYLVADPHVHMDVNSDMVQSFPEVYEWGHDSCDSPSFESEDGDTFFTIRQYQYAGAISTAKIVGFWADPSIEIPTGWVATDQDECLTLATADLVDTSTGKRATYRSDPDNVQFQTHTYRYFSRTSP